MSHPARLFWYVATPILSDSFLNNIWARKRYIDPGFPTSTIIVELHDIDVSGHYPVLLLWFVYYERLTGLLIPSFWYKLFNRHPLLLNRKQSLILFEKCLQYLISDHASSFVLAVFAVLVCNKCNSVRLGTQNPDSSKYFKSISPAAAANSSISRSACLIWRTTASCFPLWLFLARFQINPFFLVSVLIGRRLV